MTTKEQLINNIVLKCNSYLSSDQLKAVYNILNTELHNIEISNSTYEVGFIDTKFEDAVNMFLISKKLKNCSDKTIEYYSGAIKKFRKYIDKPLSSISATDIKYYLSILIKEMKIVSVNNNRRALSSFFGWCINERYIAHNPMSTIENIKVPEEEKPTYSTSEMEMMKNYFIDKRNGIRDRALLEFLYSTGCRVGEAASINRDQVNLHDKSIRIYSSKSKKYRTVYLTDSAVFYIRMYLKSRTDDCDALFVTSRGNTIRLSDKAMQRIFRECGRDLGFRAHPHKFRRTVATDMINRGAEMSSIQKMLGHAEASTTANYYARVNDTTVKIAHERFVS